MSSPALEHNGLVAEERDRLGAALAALARHPVRLKPKVNQTGKDRPPPNIDEHRTTTPYTPWNRRSRPLYKF
jgi:hypothetical protein